MSDFNPLVSIVVITYNSSEYVLETLDSAKAQTYQNIELIVSDDGSTDGSVELCRKWLSENRARFVRTELITVPKNTGIPANCNRGYRACLGEWIKGIAGDDVLLASCLEDYMKYVEKHPDLMICQSVQRVYKDTFDECNFLRKSEFDPFLYKHPGDALWQHKVFIHDGSLTTPTVFIKKELFRVVGDYDEEMPFEDWPYWIKVTGRGFYIGFMNKATVKYRLHTASYSHQRVNGSYYSNLFLKKKMPVYRKYVFPELSWVGIFFIYYEYCRMALLVRLPIGRSRSLSRLFYWSTYLPTLFYRKMVLLKLRFYAGKKD